MYFVEYPFYFAGSQSTISIVHWKNQPHFYLWCDAGWFTHLFQGFISNTGAVIWLPQCHWSKPGKYGWKNYMNLSVTWWRHQMETFSTLLAICAGNSPVTGLFPTQRPVTQSFDILIDLRLNKQLSKQSWGLWFETLSRPLWRHSNDYNTLSGSLKFDSSYMFLICNFIS